MQPAKKPIRATNLRPAREPVAGLLFHVNAAVASAASAGSRARYDV